MGWMGGVYQWCWRIKKTMMQRILEDAAGGGGGGDSLDKTDFMDTCTQDDQISQYNLNNRMVVLKQSSGLIPNYLN
jgi:hypothetical protein